MQDLKLKHYRLLIELHNNAKDAAALCKDFQAVYTVRTVLEDRAQWSDALSSIVVFLALSPFGNEVSGQQRCNVFVYREMPKFWTH